MKSSFPLKSFLIVTLGGFLFGFFLLQGLPFTFGDDLNVIYTARQTPWPILIKAVLNPLTPAWYVHGAECLLTTRAFETFLFKLLFDLFGYTPDIFQALKAFGYAGCGGLIFLLVYEFTTRRSIAVGTCLFFYLLPPVYRSLSWIADLEIQAQMFLLIAFAIFIRLYFRGGKINPSGLFLLLGMIVSAWLGMKLKETARILPFVMLGVILLHQNRGLLKWLRSGVHFFLLAASLLLLATVIPWRPSPSLALDARSGSAIFNLNPQSLLEAGGQLLVYLGAFLLLAGLSWFLPSPFLRGGGADEAISKSRLLRLFGPHNDVSPAILSGCVLFCTLWSGLALAGFLLQFETEKNVRYLATPLIPLTVSIFSVLGKCTHSLTGKSKTIFGLLILGLLVYLPLNHLFNEIIPARNFFGGIDIADYKLTRELYRDRFGASDPTWQDLDDFYRGEGAVDPASREIKIKDWDSNAPQRLKPDNLDRLVSAWGAAYILTFEESPYSRDPDKRLIYSGTTANDSLYSRLFSRKKKSRRPIYLFKVGTGRAPSPAATAAAMTS